VQVGAVPTSCGRDVMLIDFLAALFVSLLGLTGLHGLGNEIVTLNGESHRLGLAQVALIDLEGHWRWATREGGINPGDPVPQGRVLLCGGNTPGWSSNWCTRTRAAFPGPSPHICLRGGSGAVEARLTWEGDPCAPGAPDLWRRWLW